MTREQTTPNRRSLQEIQLTWLSKISVCIMVLAVSACSTFSGDPRTRTPGNVIDDQAIEIRVKKEIKDSDPGFEDAHLVVVSYNASVLLAGQVGTEQLKLKAQEVAQRSKGPKAIHNELTVSPPISRVARLNDTSLTSKVKSKLIASKRISGNKIKVVTEDSVIYLMGILPREESELAVDIARTIYGAQKIVKVFEYLD